MSIGYFDELDIVAVEAALERALQACGHELTPGQGVAAVQAEFMKSAA